MGTCHKCKSTIEDKVPYCPYCGEPTGAYPEHDTYTYEAFISYRHLPLSTKVAKRIQRDLERFRIPKGARTHPSEKKLGRVFRDEDELPASTSLSDQILDALKESRYLIVICTPETKESRWVEREIELFASLHGRDRILVALAEGERSQCLPDLLLHRKVVAEDGPVVEEPTEPLAADFRAGSHKSRREETLRLAAALLGCGFDDLRQRDRARRSILTARIIAGVAVIALAFSAVFVHQRQQILEQERQQQMSRSRYLARKVDELLSSGNRRQAVQVALDALSQERNGKDSPFVPEAYAALEKALQAYPTEHSWLPLYRFSLTNSVEYLAANEDAGTFATVDEGKLLNVYRLQDGELLNTVSLLDEGAEDASRIDWILSSCGDSYLAYPKHGLTAYFIEASTGETAWTYRMPEELYACRASSNGTCVCFSGYCVGDKYDSWTGMLCLADLPSRQTLLSKNVPVSDLSSSRVAIDETGDHICATFGKDLVLADRTGSIVATASLVQPYAYDIMWVGEVAAVMEVDELGADFPCTIQGFSLKQANGALWSYDTVVGTYAHNGLGFLPTAYLCGSYEMSDGSRYAIGVVGSRLLLIGSTDGEVKTIGSYGSPICEVSQVKGADGSWLRACTVYDGVIEAVIEGRILGQERSSIELDPPSTASFATAQDRDYLVTVPFGDSTGRHSVCVYQLAMPPAERLEGSTESALSFRAGDAREPTGRERSTISQILSKGGFDWDPDGYAAVSIDGSHAIVQDSGTVFSISIANEELCGITENAYETFVDGGFTGDKCLFYARCYANDSLGSDKLYVFDLNKELFDAKSSIAYGSALSSDGKSVLIETSATAYTLPYLSPEELVEMGEELLNESDV